MSPEPIQALCRLSKTYGPALCREPQKVEAMLRDLCPAHKREIFLIVSALREQIVPDLVSAQRGLLGGVPEAVVVSRSRHRLSENLGFTDESASWAVNSWLEASRILAAAPDIPLPVHQPAHPHHDDRTVSTLPQSGLDWIWLALCASAVFASALAICVTGWFADHHNFASFQSWLSDTILFAAGLALSASMLYFTASQFQERRIPNHWIADPNLGAAAMLCEVCAILAMPAVPVASIAWWAYEWSSSAHPHDLSFHFGRILQTLVLAVFLRRWFQETIAIQGRLAGSAIGRRP